MFENHLIGLLITNINDLNKQHNLKNQKLKCKSVI